jgi:ATP-dependent DNA helicase RecQ
MTMGEMKLKVFTLQLDTRSGKFDDREIQSFINDTENHREVIEVSDHFFIHDKRPLWAFLMTYRESRGVGVEMEGRRPSSRRRDWRRELDGADKELFDEIRAWRSKKARREGIPPYLICNNRQIADIASCRPSGLGKLREIRGLGEGKVNRWGEDILALVAAASGRMPKGNGHVREEEAKRELSGSGQAREEGKVGDR